MIRRKKRNQKGTTTIEAAFVLPVFIFFVFGIFEIGHAQMVSNLMKVSCRAGARYGSTEGVSSSQIEERVKQVLAPAMDTDFVTVIVKSGAAYDNDDDLPETADDFDELDDFEAADAESRDIFIVRATVSYNNVSLLSLPYTNSLVLTGTALTRHE